MVEKWEIKRGLADAINDHDVHRMLDFFTEDAVFVSPVGMAEGHEQIAWFFEQFFKGFPDLHLAVWYEATNTDNPMMVEWTGTGTHTGPICCRRAGTGSDRPPHHSARHLRLVRREWKDRHAPGVLRSTGAVHTARLAPVKRRSGPRGSPHSGSLDSVDKSTYQARWDPHVIGVAEQPARHQTSCIAT